MKRFYLFIASLFLVTSFAAPMAISAAPLPQQVKAQIRIYDKAHKDYHNWDDNEDRTWKLYLNNNHRKVHEFSRAKAKERAEYWKWRHEHPDGR
jgi:hypothetical protein